MWFKNAQRPIFRCDLPDLRVLLLRHPNPKGCADFGRVLCCSSVKDHSGYSPSSRRAPGQNSQQRCYTSPDLVCTSPTHIEDRQTERSFRFRSCSGSQTLFRANCFKDLRVRQGKDVIVPNRSRQKQKSSVPAVRDSLQQTFVVFDKAGTF